MRHDAPARSVFALGLAVLLAASRAAGAGPAEPPRGPIAPYLGGAFPATARAPSGDWTVAVAFPRLTFEDPVGLVPAPRGNTLYAVGRQGVVWAFENDPNTSTKLVFLDIRARCQGWDDGGLLGLAFHPQFGQTGAPGRGFVYAWYNFSDQPIPGPDRPPTNRPTRNRLARFTVPDGAAVADPNSELVLIDQHDESIWHNGGGMFFHPDDGFLYLSLGDEGGDFGNSQRIDRDLFSGVIRIDVDCRGGAVSHPPTKRPLSGQTDHYFIPNDNPWVGVPGALEEFWALGLRSPHRMTYDPVGKRIWLGDVGDGSREEIDLIERGGNYQYNYREGTLTGPRPKPERPIGNDTPPVHEYGHDQGGAVIGGYAYRGAEHAAALGGKCVFGDKNGRIWALTLAANGPARVVHLTDLPHAPTRAYGTGLSSFGEDQRGELYLCQLGTEGRLYKLARKGRDVTGGTLPRLLSQTGAFRDVKALAPAPALVPYEVNSPLWSDGAAKRRWVAVPAGARIGFAPTGAWSFPEGTVFVKHFEIGTDGDRRRRLETRFLVRTAGGGAYGVTYRSRDDGSDAELVGDEGRDETIEIQGAPRQTWHYPARRECLSCHTAASGHVLGVNTRQLHRAGAGDSEDQLLTWARLGLLDPAPTAGDLAGLPRLVAVNDTDAPRAERVRSYLDANCAHCHRPQGVRASFDARFDAPESSRHLLDGAVANALGVADARVVAAGAPERSIAYRRVTSKVPAERMPPLASSVVDEAAAAVLRDWIAHLPASPRVRLAQLAGSGRLEAGGSVTLDAEVIPGAGRVARVEFFRGEETLGAATAPPYRLAWAKAAPGSYALSARVVDDRGASATSDPVLVTIVAPPKVDEEERQAVFLTDLPWREASSGWGAIEKDRSNGERSPDDGHPLSLRGRTYPRGLGVHAASTVRYTLGKRFRTFLAEVGVDDEVGGAGSVTFQVWADGAKLWDSGVVTGEAPARAVRVDVSGRDELTLIVTDGGDGDASDHADWAAARLLPAVRPPVPRR